MRLKEKIYCVSNFSVLNTTRRFWCCWQPLFITSNVFKHTKRACFSANMYKRLYGSVMHMAWSYSDMLF